MLKIIKFISTLWYNGAMIKAYRCAALATALESLKDVIAKNEEKGVKTVIFCEDRLTLAAERTVCSAVGGTFLTSVYTFARFLTAEIGKADNVLSSQGSAMAIRKIIEDNRDKLKLFKKLTPSAAAQSVYDTIALLYSSRISAEDAEKAASAGGILGGKLHDLAIIYSEYEKYLQACGKQDRNGYLKQLGGVIENSRKVRGNCVVFLGFQAFTCTALECVRAAFSAAGDVYGLFIGGDEEIYVNEAFLSFIKAADEYGSAEKFTVEGVRNAEAEHLRKCLFNPESFYLPPVVSKCVKINEAASEEEEMEFIAACIKRHVIDNGERYAKISVMLPDLDKSERILSRVFSAYRIPYYADRQIPLSEHSVCLFILNYLACVSYGCRFQDADAVISSPFFPAESRAKDIYRNYLLKYANYRGGVKREPKKEFANIAGEDFETISVVRKTFLKGLDILSAGVKSGICQAIKLLLESFEVEKKLGELAELYKDLKPTSAAFCGRAYGAVVSVLNEAENIADGNMPLNEFIKILKSGFSSMKVSLIPPKSDAVFVGDLSSTANTGSNVVFAARLTGDVPGASSDVALLTDREIAALETVNLNISPKIRQVNARRREVIALNICAFREKLYLSYSAAEGGDEGGVSEIISYAKSVFCTKDGGKLVPVNLKKAEKIAGVLPYYCSEKLPALKRLRKYPDDGQASSVYELLVRRGFEKEANLALQKTERRDISCGKLLYSPFGSLSPTTLETYFSCPYLSFVQQGLRVKEREEGAVRPVDTGNFIHAVLQELAPEIEKFKDAESFSVRTKQLAEEFLSRAPYSALADSDSGKYTAERLVSEAVEISKGMYEQVKNSSFKVTRQESRCEIALDGGVKIAGRIDRVDESGDMVRIIDYKTGNFDASATKYYTGAKLQLPLYLLAVSKDKRAAGAYYFPAAITYTDKLDGVFRLQGFMDGSDDVVYASDNGVVPKQKSKYTEAYYSGRKIDGAMDREQFAAFLEYSRLVAGGGAREMLDGNITPSPSADVCAYCKAGGSCGFAVGRDGAERQCGTVKCSEIAEITIKSGRSGNE